MSLAIRCVESEADIPETLWQACFPSPLEGRWWYRALEGSGLGEQFRFLYAVIERAGEPVGLAPLFVMDVPIEMVVPPELHRAFAVLGRVVPSLRHQRTLFVGSPCADEGAVGLLPGVERPEALSALQRALEGKARELGAPMLVWKDFPAGYDADLARLADRCGLFRLTSFPGAVADLPGAGKEGYLAAMKASYRQKLKRRLKLSAAAVDLVTEVVQHPDTAILDTIFALFWQTYEKGATKFERLNRRFFELVADEPTSHFIILREWASGDAVAFMLCFDLGGHVINKFIGMDYARPKDWLLYFRLWDAVVELAVVRGATAVQSGQTGYTAKVETGHRLVPLTNWCRHRNPLVHRIYRFVAGRVDWSTLDATLAPYTRTNS
jgi:hypothetical protein